MFCFISPYVRDSTIVLILGGSADHVVNVWRKPGQLFKMNFQFDDCIVVTKCFKQIHTSASCPKIPSNISTMGRTTCKGPTPGVHSTSILFSAGVDRLKKINKFPIIGGAPPPLYYFTIALFFSPSISYFFVHILARMRWKGTMTQLYKKKLKKVDFFLMLLMININSKLKSFLSFGNDK